MADRPRVIVIERMDPLGPELLKGEADVIELYDRPGETLEQHLPEADGLVVRIARITAERIALAPRLNLPTCIVTPHVAGGSVEARRETARMVAEETLRVLRGQAPRHSYNPELSRVSAR